MENIRCLRKKRFKKKKNEKKVWCIKFGAQDSKFGTSWL